MTVDEIYTRLKYLANKGGWNGFVSPKDFEQLFNRASQQYFNKLYLQYAATKKISDGMSPFVPAPQNITVDNVGKWIIDPNLKLLHVTALMGTFNGKKVKIEEVMDDRLANHLSSDYDAPSTEFPIYTQYNTLLQFYPINIGSATLTYLKRPTDVKWAYTLVSNRPVYDEANSVQTEWADTEIDTIIYMMLIDLGINMKDNELEQFAQLETKQSA